MVASSGGWRVTEYLLEDIAEWIESEAIGLAHGTTIFSGRLPDTDGPSVAVLLYSARPPVDVMDTEDNQPVADRPMVQLLVRHTDYKLGLKSAIAAHKALLTVRGLVFLHTRFLAVHPQQSPFYVGDDTSGDPLFSSNYELETTEA